MIERLIYRLMAISLMLFFGALFFFCGITFAILTATKVVHGNFAIIASVLPTLVGLPLLGFGFYNLIFRRIN